MNSKLAVWRQ